MTDKEMIEEMAKRLASWCEYGNFCYTNVVGLGELEFAKELLKYYQPKIPEGSVVISREEKQAYESLAKFFIYDKPIKSRVYEFIKKIKDQVRKETAREILQDFDNHGVYSKDYTDFMRKQFGVEEEK